MKNKKSSIILSNTSHLLGEIRTPKTNYDVVENKQILAIPKIINPIRDYIFDKYPENFKQVLINDVERLENTDLIISGQVQIGKTSVIITTAWISLYCRNEIPIIISWDLLSVMSQTLSRINKFDEEIRTNFKDTNFPGAKFLLNPTIIKSGISNQDIQNIFVKPSCLITILQPGRLDSIGSLIREGHKKGFKFRIIIDESDHSIKGSETETELKILQNFISISHINLMSIVYVSATNFAVYNSINRFIARKYRIITIPSNIYEKKNLIYRSHMDFEKIPTNCLIGMDKSDEITDEQWIQIIDLFRSDFALMKIVPTNNNNMSIQPNIGLLDVSFKNEPKEDLAARISKELPYIHIVVYMSPNSKVYYNGNVYYQFREGVCIGDILDDFKRIYTTKMRAPILIISTGLAGRAQTFKTSDNEWVLTHHFLNKSTLSIDVLVQSVRGAGQYKPSDPILKLYASQNVITSLETSWYNNNILTDKIALYQDKAPMRDIIEQVSFISSGHKPIKFISRKNIDDTSIDRIGKDYNAIASSRESIFKKAEMIRISNGCDGILEVARLYYLPVSIYYNILNNCTSDLKRLQYDKFNTDEPYKGMKKTIQASLRQAIKDEIIRLANINIDKCQLCYNVNRQKDLNKLHHLKSHDNFKAQIIALSYNNKNTIPIVIYDKNYLDAFQSDTNKENPNNMYFNKVLIWPSTDEKYRCYANTAGDRTKINLFQLKH